MLKSRNAAKPLSSISLIRLSLAALERSGSLTTREGEKDESAPPQTGGDLRPFVEVRCDTHLYSASGGRSRPHLSLREGLEPFGHTGLLAAAVGRCHPQGRSAA